MNIFLKFQSKKARAIHVPSTDVPLQVQGLVQSSLEDISDKVVLPTKISKHEKYFNFAH